MYVADIKGLSFVVKEELISERLVKPPFKLTLLDENKNPVLIFAVKCGPFSALTSKSVDILNFSLMRLV